MSHSSWLRPFGLSISGSGRAQSPVTTHSPFPSAIRPSKCGQVEPVLPSSPICNGLLKLCHLSIFFVYLRAFKSDVGAEFSFGQGACLGAQISMATFWIQRWNAMPLMYNVYVICNMTRLSQTQVLSLFSLLIKKILEINFNSGFIIGKLLCSFTDASILRLTKMKIP